MAQALFGANNRSRKTQMAQKAIIELRDVKPRQHGDYQVRAAVRPELKVSAHKKAQELLERRAITTRDINIARALIGVGLLFLWRVDRV